MAVDEVIIKSPIALAMGAKVSLVGPGYGTYLIIGRGILVDSLVNTAGGKVLMRLNGQKLIATLPFTGFLFLRGNYQISHIGPISIDTRKLAKLAEILTPNK